MILLLKNGHIIIPVDLIQSVLEGELQVNLVYYPERNSLLIAGKSKSYFEKLHKTHWQTLKDKNLAGDKSLFVREILIDNDLDDHDRELSFDVKNTGIIAVQL
ncbi:hypothetical protein [Runella aurantiaca]|uniref:Uncharacterized protein n=1 Tax=Runella aurantiaca TaxID=2282308 RepID=A0A369I9S5_9BACT|nr:hypothetical protein [Runella aurantiaca]RDB06368.1 hypothetical protein DVG78_08885 [Runella aurantiaca]